jgi:hypothetical protein
MLATHAQTKWRETDTLCVFLLVSFHESIKTTPFRLNSGRDPRTPLSWGLNVRSRVPAVEEFITNLQQSLQKAKLSLDAARNRQNDLLIQKGEKLSQIGDEISTPKS